jgi:hypothetical protein
MKKKRFIDIPKKTMLIMREAGFTNEQIREYYIEKEKHKNAKLTLLSQIKKNKPIAKIFFGLNTNSM